MVLLARGSYNKGNWQDSRQFVKKNEENWMNFSSCLQQNVRNKTVAVVGERNPVRLARFLDVASAALRAFPDIC
jgi:hypothetical protein